MAGGTKKEKGKAYAKRGLVQARLGVDEFRDVLTKAQLYTKGNLSEFVRQAVTNWRPIKKVAR